MTHATQPEFSRPVQVDKLPRLPKHMKFKATPDELKALAKRFELIGLSRFDAEAVVTAARSGKWARANVTLWAAYTQECVVTVTPFETEKTLSFSRVFRAEQGGHMDDTGFMDVNDDAEPDADPLEDGRFDLGEVIAEEFGLELDPFPKAPGVEYDGDFVDAPPSFAEESDDPAPQKASPFAALEKIRDKLAKE